MTSVHVIVVGVMVLVVSAVAAAATTTTATAAGAAATTQGRSAAELFALDHVRLLDGPFKDAQEVDRKHLLAHDPDRLLAPFRAEAGLGERKPRYGSWESQGLGGQTAGHYLSAIAMMHAATGDAELKRRVDYMVAELAECQRANGNGYVGGVPQGNAIWADIAAGKMKVTGFGLNDRWVPWYNLHKTFQGLRDAHLIGRNEQAKQVLVGLADWCDALLSKMSDEQVQQMLAAEHGGMNEVLADVAAITGDEKYLKLARRFSHRAILDPLADGRDDLTGKHANTQIPKVIGFRRIASLDGDDRFRRAAGFFWDNVTTRRSVAIGGNSVDEHFHPPNDFSSMIEHRTGPETCNTYNMLRLTEGLFTDDPQPRYADYYERALFNHILSSQHPHKGGFVYFTPMRPRQYRVYSQAGQAFWCCVGTGMENHAKYGRFIYARGGRADEVFVNLFIASELKWDARGVTLRQETKFPNEAATRIVINVKQPTRFMLRVRHPHWVETGDAEVMVNGEAYLADSGPSSYMKFEQTWKDGDTIDIKLPMHVAAERMPDRSGYVAFRYGPLVLAAATGTEDLHGLYGGAGRGDHIAGGPLLPLHDAPMLVTDAGDSQLARQVRPIENEPLTFAVPDVVRPERWRTLKLIPFHRLHDARYVIYWRIIPPEKYAAERKRVEAEEQARLALDAATIDRVVPGNQQSEVDHGFKGERTGNGHHRDRSWRDARGGWFSYELKAPRNEKTELLVTYWGSDRGRRFDVLVDEKKVAEVTLENPKPEAFYDVRYPLPAQRGADRATVKFQAHEGSTAGGVFDVRVVRVVRPQQGRTP